MDYSKYVGQVNRLKQYANISKIPPDSHDVSAASAKKTLGFYGSIQLNSTQQSVYDEAASMTADIG
jgi:hypothetical protein